MRRWRYGWIPLMALVASCAMYGKGDPEPDDTTLVCTKDADCLTGRICRDGMCVPDDMPTPDAAAPLDGDVPPMDGPDDAGIADGNGGEPDEPEAPDAGEGSGGGTGGQDAGGDTGVPDGGNDDCRGNDDRKKGCRPHGHKD